MPDWNHATPLVSAAAYSQAMIPLRVEGTNPTNPALDTFSQVAISTVISAAVGAGGGVQQASIDLFVNLADHAVPVSVTAIQTGGYARAGEGGATYIADDLATAGLAGTSPFFCAADSTGRFFRLAPQNGKIAISQGGALGGTNNDQPAAQAAIGYAKAIGCRELLWDFDTVSLWCPLRTSATTSEWATDGFSIVVSAPIKFTGLATRTHIKLLNPAGASLETNVQNVGGNVWRGSGIRLFGGTQSAPSINGLSCFAMQDIWLDGGCAYTGSRATPTIGSPDGADLTNKGLHLQDTECDAITLTNCVISGFKGEACYLAGTTQTVQIFRNCTISGSNQSAFNPSTGTVWADNCNFGNSFISTETLGGIGGRYTNCRFYNSVQTGITGGPANGLLYNYAYPTRVAGTQPPWIDLIECDFQNAGELIVSNFVRIKGRMTDSTLSLSAVPNGSLTSTYIELEYTLDQSTQSPICLVAGPPTLTTLISGATGSNYVPPVRDLHVRLNVHRTQNAIANAFYAIPYSVGGYIDQNSCSLTVGEADGVAYLVAPTSNFALPLVKMDGPTSSQLIGSGRPLGMFPATITAGPYALTVSNPRMSLLFSGTATAIATTMAAPFTAPYGFAYGQKARIYWDPGTTTGTTFTFAHNGTGLRLNSDCTLAVFGDWLEVEFNATTGLWHECGRSIHAA